MAMIQTKWATGQAAVPQAFTAGAVVAYKATIDVPVGTTLPKNEPIEFAVLPADHELVSVTIIPDGDFATASVNIGLMTGRVGSDDSERTMGKEIYDAAALSAVLNELPVSAYNIARSDADRSIGLQFTDDVIGAGQKLTLLIQMYQ